MLAPPTEKLSEDLRRARQLALLIPAVLLGGALLSQYVGGLYPCEMCLWQRWPHRFAILFAIAAILLPPVVPRVRLLTLLAAAALAVSGAIGAFHAGVEYGWWEGLTTCTSSAMTMDDIMSVPLVRCDQVQWSLAGISLAGFNAIFSLGGAALVAILAIRKSAR
jgi:disulfide bond formation protein DsbB